MNFQQLKEKYNLPESIKVEIEVTRRGYYAKLPEYPGCMTEASNLWELFENITDAVLTYFEVSRKDALKVKGFYMPERLSTFATSARQQRVVDRDTQLKGEFLYYLAQNSHGIHTRIR